MLLRSLPNVTLFFDDYLERDERTIWRQLGFLLLDTALGEYATEMRVGGILFGSRGSKYFIQARPLEELPRAFKEYFQPI
jgi:hypothetical protein